MRVGTEDILQINSIWDEIKIIRKYKRGSWYKTKYRGWLRPEHYFDYITNGYDPIILKEEIW
jgi:hypothetical protein